jgi:cholest-4-en-3-one 26-monooxygenase
MSGESFSNGELNIAPENYQQNGYPHREWTFLRQHQPVYRYEGRCAEPFWAITKHADIVQIAKQPHLFTNRPRIVILADERGSYAEQEEPPFRHLLTMDPPQHGEYRSIMSRRFTPRAVLDLKPKIERITREVLDAVVDLDECDFVLDIAARILARGDSGVAGLPARGLGSALSLEQRVDRRWRP